MSIVTIEDAQARLSEIIERLGPGEEILITRDRLAVARLIAVPAPETKTQRRLGTLKGTVRHMALDFDAPLEDFREYME